MSNIIRIIEGDKEYDVLITDSGSEMWYIPNTNIWHRELGPAIIYSNNWKSWKDNGVSHRLDGPAYEFATSSFTPQYWINGVKLNAKNQEEFEIEKRLLILK